MNYDKFFDFVVEEQVELIRQGKTEDSTECHRAAYAFSRMNGKVHYGFEEWYENNWMIEDLKIVKPLMKKASNDYSFERFYTDRVNDYLSKLPISLELIDEEELEIVLDEYVYMPETELIEYYSELIYKYCDGAEGLAKKFKLSTMF